MSKVIAFSGRQLVSHHRLKLDSRWLEQIAAISNHQCQRCGSKILAKLPDGRCYCRTCLNLGRITEGDFLIRIGTTQERPLIPNGGLVWKGRLTPAQRQVSAELIISYHAHRSRLIHAVTGAGKTEMLFECLSRCLSEGRRACIATPRIDVVNELAPRLNEAFKIKIGVYHGQNYHQPDNESLIVCTTHQLLKFYHAFDLLVIDESDAFPFSNQPFLHFGVKQALKSHGSQIWLTATPDKHLSERVERREIDYSKLNRRFHGSDLHVPRLILFWRQFLTIQGRFSHKLKRLLDRLLDLKKPVLVFVPRIRELPLYLHAFQETYPLKKCAAVHAGSADRQKIVSDFRQGNYDFLFTTTILERGVTIKHVQVVVLAADDVIYSAASLIQIAGRAGRAFDDTYGEVLFCYHRYTKQIDQAVRQIKGMNQ